MGAPKGGKGWVPKGGKGKGKDKSKGKGKDGGDEKSWVKKKGLVLVTGASGFLAMSCIRRLFDRGYKVRGTVRSLSNEKSCGPLRSLFPELELVEADLLGGEESFEKACEGCKYVLHTASPFQLSVNDPQKDLVDPALKGTESVVKAAIKAGVTRLVQTSSIAAVGPPQSWRQDASKGDADKVFDESDWNMECSLTEGPYLYSKVVAEKKMWELVKDTELQGVAINPSFIIGPMMTDRTDSESVRFMKSMLEGTMKLEGYPLGVVDCRDVAAAHVAALETEGAAGKRFLVTTEVGWDKLQLADLIRDRFKGYAIPKEGTLFGFNPKFSPQLAKDVLHWKPRPVEISLRDMANAAIRHGIVEKKYVLKPTKFMKVGETMPDGKGLNYIVSIVSIGEAEELRGGETRRDVVVGDDSALVTLGLVGSELDGVAVGKVIEVRNAQVRMVKNFIRVTVGKWGKVSKHEGEATITPNAKKDVSATEYEQVAA